MLADLQIMEYRVIKQDKQATFTHYHILCMYVCMYTYSTCMARMKLMKVGGEILKRHENCLVLKML